MATDRSTTHGHEAQRLLVYEYYQSPSKTMSMHCVKKSRLEQRDSFLVANDSDT